MEGAKLQIDRRRKALDTLENLRCRETTPETWRLAPINLQGKKQRPCDDVASVIAVIGKVEWDKQPDECRPKAGRHLRG